MFVWLPVESELVVRLASPPLSVAVPSVCRVSLECAVAAGGDDPGHWSRGGGKLTGLPKGGGVRRESHGGGGVVFVEGERRPGFAGNRPVRDFRRGERLRSRRIQR